MKKAIAVYGLFLLVEDIISKVDVYITLVDEKIMLWKK